MFGQRFQALQQSGQRTVQGLGPRTVDHVRALATLAFHQAFAGQFIQRPLCGDAGNAKGLGKIELSGDARFQRDLAIEDAVAQQTEHLVVKRGRQIIAQQLARV